MEFSKEVCDIFHSVMRVQGKNAIFISMLAVGNMHRLKYDVANADIGDRIIKVNGISVIIDEYSEHKLQNIRFVVRDGNIAMECINPCTNCKQSNS